MNRFIMILTILILLNNCCLFADKPLPPLVPEGERFENIQELLDNISTSSGIQCLAFSPDGSTIVSGTENGSIQLWDVASGSILKIFRGHAAKVSSIAIGLDGDTIVSGSWDHSIKIWSITKGALTKTLNGHSSKINAVAISPDTSIIVSGANDSLRWWDAKKGTNSATYFRRSHGIVSSLAFSHDGSRLISVYRGKIRLWDVASRKILKSIKSSNFVDAVIFSRDGNSIISGTSSGIQIWDVANGVPIKTLLGHTSDVNSIAISPDGNTLVSGSNDNTVRLWNAHTLTLIKTLTGHNSRVTSISISPDGNFIASGSEDHTIRLWSAITGEPVKILNGQSPSVTAIAISHDGKRIASGFENGNIWMWDSETASPEKTLIGNNASVMSIAFSSDRKLCSASKDKILNEWSIEEKTLTGPKHIESEGTIEAYAFNSDGHSLAFFERVHIFHSGNHEVMSFLNFWSIDRNALEKTIHVEEKFPFQYNANHLNKIGFPSAVSIAFGIDSNSIAISNGFSIEFWDVAKETQTNSIQMKSVIASALAFSPDNKSIVLGCDDGTIQFIDILTEKTTIKLLGHNSRVTCLTFNSEGNILVSGDANGWIHLYKEIKLGNNYKLSSILIAGKKGNWLAYDSDQKVLRGDDGSFLLKKDKNGTLKPVPPSTFSKKENIRIIEKPQSLDNYDGILTNFSIKLKNTGNSPVGWISIVKEKPKDIADKLVFHPPPTEVVLKPQQEVTLNCGVSARTEYDRPTPRTDTLHLKITSTNGLSIPISIPINVEVPGIEFGEAQLIKQQTEFLGITFYSSGKEGLPPGLEITARVGDQEIDKNTTKIWLEKQGNSFAFNIPGNITLDKDSKLSVTVTKTNLPIHKWEFKNIPNKFPTPIWYWYTPGIILLIVAGVSFYYFQYYRHPLVLKLSEHPQSLLSLTPGQLVLADHLLKRTHIYKATLAPTSISRNRFEKVVAFCKDFNAKERCDYLSPHLGATYEKLPNPTIPAYLLKLSDDFILNISQCLLMFPPDDITAHEIICQIKTIQAAKHQICIIITTDEEIQTQLRETTMKTDNLWVAPSGPETTSLLLSHNPLEILASLIASQVKVTRISPYQTKGGVDKESIFFGREHLLSSILQREPANYILVGGRQLGKTSLLKAIRRRYQDDSTMDCHYLVLSGSNVSSHIAGALGLPTDTPLPELSREVRSLPGEKRHLFLIDEADAFILSECQSKYGTLNHFRAMSEEGRCSFILAGFWNLYRSAALDYQSPIKNFGETLMLEALEPQASRDLATKPMELLNIRYERDELVDTLIHETGGRANLIAIICNEMLKSLDMTQRVLTAENLEWAMDSHAVHTSLSGWETMTKDENTNRLDRIIVYTTIDRDSFTQPELLLLLKTHGADYKPEQVRQSLMRLELAFILERKQDQFTFRVPLFKNIIKQQGPEELLAGELGKRKYE